MTEAYLASHSGLYNIISIVVNLSVSCFIKITFKFNLTNKSSSIPGINPHLSQAPIQNFGSLGVQNYEFEDYWKCLWK